MHQDQEQSKNLLKEDDVKNRIELAALENYKEIMEVIVPKVNEQANDIAKAVIKHLEDNMGQALSEGQKEGLVDNLSLGIWADISNTLSSQLADSLKEDQVVQ